MADPIKLPSTQGHQAENAWRVLWLLFLANLLNVYDRVIPAVIAESLRLEFDLTDAHIGFVATAFTLVYAIAGVPLGRLADTKSRRAVIGAGLATWSVFTAITGWTSSMISFVLARMGVGIGEASYAPAATSMISDLFPHSKRSRATGVFMLGLPLGMILGFISVGAIVEAFDSWRAPFFIAAVPGLILAAVFLFIREPKRGASELRQEESGEPVTKPIYRILKIRTFWWVILSGVGFNFATYAVTAFMVPLLQRYFQADLQSAALIAGLLIGVTGLVGMSAGGMLADHVQRRSRRGRLLLCGGSMLLAACLTWLSLQFNGLVQFAWVFGIGWLIAYLYPVCIYPAVQDLVVPQLRSTAMAVYFAGMYLLGAAFGTLALGFLSDHYAELARIAEGVQEISAAHRAIGLHDAMILVPMALLFAAITTFMAARSFLADVERVRSHQVGVVANAQ